MATSTLAWAFNNPELSDIKVVLTTETAGQYRARMQDAAPKPPTRQRANTPADKDAASASSSASSTPLVEQLHGHKLVLKSNSEFFKGVVDWSSSSDSATPGGSTKRSREEPEVAVLSLSDEQQFATAKMMIRFMYTQQLDADVDRSEVMRLMQLADEFSVPSLRLQCMVRLAATPLKSWLGDGRQALCSCWTSVSNDSLAEGELAAAADSLASKLAAFFANLEAALADDGNWKLLCSLPQAVLLEVLRSPDLVVRSENTVLVAALSWLRTAGKGASEEERTEVMAEVRLLRLSPWFLSWFIFDVPEAKTLLGATVLPKLVHYLAHTPDVKKQLRADDKLHRGWLKGRRGERTDIKVALELSVEGSDLIKAVEACRAEGNEGGRWSGQQKFLNGIMWSVRVEVGGKAVVSSTKQDEDDSNDEQTDVFVGVVPLLRIGNEMVEASSNSMLECPVNFLMNVGDKVREKRAVSGVEIGEGYGHWLAIDEAAAPSTALQPWLKGGRLTVTCDVLG
jgi:hypothetical protein